MGFQFQSIGSVSTFLVEDLRINYAQLGALIGLYDLPGIILAIPGGLLVRRFGDKRVVMMALGLMALPLLPFERPRGSPPAGRLPDGGGLSIGAAPRKETADDRPQP